MRALAYLLVVSAAAGAAWLVWRRQRPAAGGAAPVPSEGPGSDAFLFPALDFTLPSLDFGTWGDDAPADVGPTFFDSVMSAFQPRGIRNNNPGNVRISGSAWAGKVPIASNTDGTFEQFSGPFYGLRVIAYLLLKYQRDKGKKTIKALIEDAGGWAPVNNADKNPANYGDTVAAAVGLRETDYVDLWTGNTLAGIVAAIVDFENGQQPYDATLIASAVASARSALS